MRCAAGTPAGSASAGSTSGGSRSPPASGSTPTRYAGSRPLRAEGKPSTPSRYARATVRSVFAMDRRHPALTLERPGEEPVPGLFFGIVANTSPWTYFRDRPIVLTPDASFDAGLDLVEPGPDAAAGDQRRGQGMLTRKGIRGRHTRAFRDLREFRLVADRPTHLQVDGDYIGERSGRPLPRGSQRVARHRLIRPRQDSTPRGLTPLGVGR